jgi:hypothetical protein
VFERLLQIVGALAQFPRSRAFSIAVTACAAKFSSKPISLSEKGLTSLRRAINPSNAAPFRNGTDSAVRISAASMPARVSGALVVNSDASALWTKRSHCSSRSKDVNICVGPSSRARTANSSG